MSQGLPGSPAETPKPPANKSPIAVNRKTQMPMAATEVASGNPLISAKRSACAPAKRQKTIQPFASKPRNAHYARNQADAASPECFMRSSRMPWAIRKASSSAWLALSLGSQAV